MRRPASAEAARGWQSSKASPYPKPAAPVSDPGMTLLGQRGPPSHLGVKSRQLCSALPQECADGAAARPAFHPPARDHPFAF